MGRDGLLIGEVAARSGVSRKALRLYEAAGILPPPRRTTAGYRVYGSEALALLAFVSAARRLGLRLDEITEIVAIRRSGGIPCARVRALVARKAAEVERQLIELRKLHARLLGLARSWRRAPGRSAAVCPHIENPTDPKRRRRR